MDGLFTVVKGIVSIDIDDCCVNMHEVMSLDNRVPKWNLKRLRKILTKRSMVGDKFHLYLAFISNVEKEEKDNGIQQCC